MRKNGTPRKYKCCDAEELVCYYYIACKTIHHKSCLECRRGIIYLDSYKVFCNSKYEQYAVETITDAEHEINDIQMESLEKSQALEKHRSLSVAFENDVAEAEAKSKDETEIYQFFSLFVLRQLTKCVSEKTPAIFHTYK